MMQLGVVAHEKREAQALELVTGQQASAYNVTGSLTCEDNHLVVLTALARTCRLTPADWICVLEDDAVPVSDFRFHVEHALEYSPSPVVGLYLGTGNPSGQIQRQIRQAVVAAQDVGHAWIVGDCLIGSVGYALRVDLLDDMIDFIAGRQEELPLRISRWAQHRGIDISYTQPSLVDHDDGPSVSAPYRVQPGVMPTARRAWRYGTRDGWDTPAVRLGHCPNWSAA